MNNPLFTGLIMVYSSKYNSLGQLKVTFENWNSNRLTLIKIWLARQEFEGEMKVDLHVDPKYH